MRLKLENYKKTNSLFIYDANSDLKLYFWEFVKIFEKYYQTLEIPSDSSEQEIKAAYRRLVKIYHPDKSGDPSTRNKFVDVNEAYEVLLRRDEYVRDAILRYQNRRAGAGVQTRTPVRKDYAAGARHRAVGNSYKSFAEFEKTPIYKTAVVVNSAIDYVFVGIGLLMIASPFIDYYSQVKHGRADQQEPQFSILPIFLGILFLYGLWYFLIKNKHL